MKGAGCFALYVAAAFALGGALAGPLFAALSAVGLAPMDFPEFTLRLVQLAALLGLWPLLHVLGLRGAQAFGLSSGTKGRSFLAGALGGFAAGVLLMALLFALLLALGVRSGSVHPGSVEWPARLAGLLMSAAAVALVEEVWFRGALHSAFRRIGGVGAALFAVAALYSAVHFIDPGPANGAGEGASGGGFAVLSGAFHRFADPDIAGAAAALVAAGVLLGVVRHRTGRVAECIGIHAGWVLLNKSGRTLTTTEPDSRWAWLASGYDGVLGWAACALFSLAALLCWHGLRPGRGAD